MISCTFVQNASVLIYHIYTDLIQLVSLYTVINEIRFPVNYLPWLLILWLGRVKSVYNVMKKLRAVGAPVYTLSVQLINCILCHIIGKSQTVDRRGSQVRKLSTAAKNHFTSRNPC